MTYRHLRMLGIAIFMISVAIPDRAHSEFSPCEFQIIPGDYVTIFVEADPALSSYGSHLLVRRDGTISWPEIGNINVVGRPMKQVLRELEVRVKAAGAHGGVQVLLFDSENHPKPTVHIMGEVRKTEGIPYCKGMKLLDVIKLADGLLADASGNQTVIVRQNESGQRTSIKVRLEDLLKGDASQNLEIMPDDAIIIPQSWK